MNRTRARSQSTAIPGFTLIEILVVVAIIALLIAILVPAMSKARDQARRAVCATNLHQQMLSMFMYSADFKGYAPFRGWFSYDISEVRREAYGYGGSSTKTLINWGLLVGGNAINGTSGKIAFKYVKGWEILYCPITIRTRKDVPKASPSSINGGLPTLWDATVSFTFGGYNYALPMANRAGAPPLDRKVYPRASKFLADNYVVVMMKKAKLMGLTSKTYSAPIKDSDRPEIDSMLPKAMPIGPQPLVMDWVTGGNDIPHENGAQVAYSDGHVRYSKFLPGQSGATSTSLQSFQWWDYITSHQ